jgi:hypothetical protein
VRKEENTKFSGLPMHPSGKGRQGPEPWNTAYLKTVNYFIQQIEQLLTVNVQYG